MTDTIVAPTPVGPADDDALIVEDLLMDLEEVAGYLVGRLDAGAALDAYLLAAGAAQIVEDHLHRDVVSTRRTADYLSRQGGGVWRSAAGALHAFATAGEAARRLPAADRRARAWLRHIAELRDQLAPHVIEDRPLDPRERGELAARAYLLLARIAALPNALRADVLRLPACFRSFDQRPADMVELARCFARARAARDRPVLVLGVRTSGGYLAPLVAAALAAAGFADVAAATVRPGYPLHRDERAVLRDVVRRGGDVAVVDDPPATGRSLDAVVSELRRYGIPASSITLLLPLFGRRPPRMLRRHRHLTLPFERWAVHAQLTPAAVGDAMAELTGRPVVRVECLSDRALLASTPTRGSLSALFRVDMAGSEVESRMVLVRGAGLGYLGRHALAVTRAVRDHMPEVYGFRDGLLYRAWLPEERRLDGAEAMQGGARPDWTEQIAGYVADRAAAMPAVADRSLRLTGQQPVWEVASMCLAGAFGRLGLALRPLLLDGVARRLTAVTAPSVVDGNTRVREWFVDPGDDTRLRKIDADVRDFSNQELTCYDPVFDLAGLDPGGRDDVLASAVRARYEARTGSRVDDERWLLYELVHLWDRARTGRLSEQEARRASSRAVQRYLAARYLDEATATGDGPLVAVDLDGVLESSPLGFSSTTPAGAVALRSLARHGYRPVLVTGRSLDEVRERCATYRLAGGAAEYGAVAYDHIRGTEVELLTRKDRAHLGRLREVLRATRGVCVDDDYAYAVRAFRLDGAGRRRGLDAGVVAAALTHVDGAERRIRAVPGDAQTDFVAAHVDKGAGLGQLAVLLGGTAGPAPVALAVGDTAADLPMLALARLACAPANADPELRSAGVRLLGEPYQAGFAAAVSLLLGHAPGSCPTCRPHDPAAPARLLLSVLGAQEAGRWGIPRRLLHVAGLAVCDTGGRP